jgi:hypothetical protein
MKLEIFLIKFIKMMKAQVHNHENFLLNMEINNSHHQIDINIIFNK